jgi:hypothetical protein
MFASGLHNQSFDENYSNRVHGHVKPHAGGNIPRQGWNGPESDRIEVSSRTGNSNCGWYW